MPFVCGEADVADGLLVMVKLWEGPETLVCEVVGSVVDIDGLGMGCVAVRLAVCHGWTASRPTLRSVTVSPRCEGCATPSRTSWSSWRRA